MLLRTNLLATLGFGCGAPFAHICAGCAPYLAPGLDGFSDPAVTSLSLYPFARVEVRAPVSCTEHRLFFLVDVLLIAVSQHPPLGL